MRNFIEQILRDVRDNNSSGRQKAKKAKKGSKVDGPAKERKNFPFFFCFFYFKLKHLSSFLRNQCSFPFAFPHSCGSMPSKQSDIHTVYQTSFMLSYTSNSNTDCFKYFIEQQLRTERLNCNDSSFKVLGAIGHLSFGKFGRCIRESCLDESSNSI